MGKLIFAPDESLFNLSSLVDTFDHTLSELIEDMIDVLYKYNGVGIAAPQIGEFVRVIVFMPLATEADYPMPPRVMVNPVIYDYSKNFVDEWEGSLSMPNTMVKIFRPLWIDVHFQDEYGQSYEERFEFLSARIIQHCINHLDGVLISKYITHNNLRLIEK
jgi:peptide deformylase